MTPPDTSALHGLRVETNLGTGMDPVTAYIVVSGVNLYWFSSRDERRAIEVRDALLRAYKQGRSDFKADQMALE